MEVSEMQIQLRIGGMTCVNCQNKIEKELRHTEGIIQAKVSYNNGTAQITYDKNKTSLKKITALIERLDYQVLKEKDAKGRNPLEIIAILGCILFLYILLQSAGILNLLVPTQLADTKMGYGMLFVIGLMTSVHCIAMCGGINLSQCIPSPDVKKRTEVENGYKEQLSALRPSLSYNLGRVFSYTFVGLVLGTIGFLIGGGTEVGMSAILQGLLKIIAGLFMVIMGINMLGLFPGLRKFTIRVPAFLARRIGAERARTSRPFIVGILNGFMPCGPLQSMWIVALASANPIAGALSMFLFSLGTVPLMLGLGFLVAALGKKFTDKVMTVGAVLVVVLGLAMLSQGGALCGWLPPDLLLALVIAFCIAGVLLSLPVKKPIETYLIRAVCILVVIGACVLWRVREAMPVTVQDSDTQTEVVDGEQVVTSTLSPGRFPNITVQAGVPVKWVIDAPEGSINGCNYKIMSRDLGLEYTFHTGENIITFTPEKAGTIRYNCWMGMIYGNIFVTDGSESSEVLSDSEVTVPVPAGYSIPTDTISKAAVQTDQNGNTYQEVSMNLTEDGFAPAVIVVQKDLTVLWNIDNELSSGENGAGTELLVPVYSTKLSLEAGKNQLTLYPAESFDASTGDNRFYCYVKVVDDLNTVDENAIREEISAFEPLIYPTEVFETSGMSCCGS